MPALETQGNLFEIIPLSQGDFEIIPLTSPFKL